MAILVTNVKIGIQQPDSSAIEQAVHQLRVPASQLISAHLYKKSLDARHHDRMQFVCSVLIRAKGDEKALCRRCKNAAYREEKPLELSHGTVPLNTPIVIAGFGPAGIFCAYTLAKEGYCPVVIERGYDMDRRVSAVHDFWTNRRLNPECNVQFGEGGAGTFSDGKLTTRISDPRCDYVLERFAAFGAPEEILSKAKPHIGTDKLRGVIKSMREEIIRLGGKVLFQHKLERILTKNGKLYGIVVNGEIMETEHLVLAVGHSARDTFEMLLQEGMMLEPKNFSVGVRIEHRQEEINRGLYGRAADSPYLPQGEYQLSYRENGRGVYTFCMCPGGLVVPSSSSEETVVTNGMSEFLRDQENANSALVVGVGPEDFGEHPLDGMRFQLGLERAAFRFGGQDYSAPGSDVGHFLSGTTGLELRSVQPSYSLGLQAVSFHQLFPPFVSDMLEKGLRCFDQKIRGFAAPDAILTGVETRTSSPVRITRDTETCQSALISGIYPCGEGAGYAGGIMSAAVDGIRIAEQLISLYCPMESPETF